MTLTYNQKKNTGIVNWTEQINKQTKTCTGNLKRKQNNQTERERERKNQFFNQIKCYKKKLMLMLMMMIMFMCVYDSFLMNNKKSIYPE